MLLIEIGKEIRWIKEHLLPEFVKMSVFPLQKKNGHWVSVLAAGQQVGIGSNNFNNSRRIKVTLDREVHVDTFPVSISEYMEFVRSGDYFEERYWSGHKFLSQHRGGDDVIRKILEPTQYSYEWPLLEHIPVTNITWFEAHAYARWKRKILPSEMLWEYAANGSRGEERIKPYLKKLRRDLPDEKAKNMEKFMNSFSDYGCWGMLGGIIEWCGDQFVNAAYRHYSGGTIIFYEHDSFIKNKNVNIRGFAPGDYRARKPENIAFRRQLKPLESNHDTGFRCCEIY